MKKYRLPHKIKHFFLCCFFIVMFWEPNCRISKVLSARNSHSPKISERCQTMEMAIRFSVRQTLADRRRRQSSATLHFAVNNSKSSERRDKSIRNYQTRKLSYFSPQFRNTSARKSIRHSHRSGTSGTQRHPHDADLHARFEKQKFRQKSAGFLIVKKLDRL